MYDKDELIGKKFSRLTVKQLDDSRNDKTYFICKCDCGNEVSVNISQLVYGHTKSCGCLQREKVLTLNQNKKKYNRYDLETYSYGVCFSSNTEQEILFDKEDFDLINKYCWRIDANGYVVTSAKNESTGKYNKIIKLHRFLMQCPQENVVDHKNTNKLDNRKSNLRICKQSDNTKNHNLYKTNKSGISGVIWDKKNNNWRVRIGDVNIGSFRKLDEAIKARKEAEEKIFGEFNYIGKK